LVGGASAETYQDPKQIGQISLDMGGLLMEDAEANTRWSRLESPEEAEIPPG
jgi:hypothetical protein